MSIHTIARQFNKGKKALPFIAGLLLVGVALVWGASPSSAIEAGLSGVLGGPTPQPMPLAPIEVTSVSGEADVGFAIPNHTALALAEGVSLQDDGGILSVTAAKTGIITYTVEQGDTLSEIADQFGVSIQTLLSANPDLKTNYLRVGQKIDILPVSGILYHTKQGETASSIAAAFHLNIEQLSEFNRSVDFNRLAAGTAIVIPGARSQGRSSGSQSSLPSYPDYFEEPARGFNWGRLHAHNAVDIANACGTAVRAAAEGLVVPDGDYGDGRDGWNGGYGSFVLLEHPNGTKTRYAHLDAVAVSVGEYIQQGDIIGEMGNTGNVHGPTGCHLHLEVLGAQNPFTR